MVIVSFNLLVDLHEQSSLRVVTQVELLAELFDDRDEDEVHRFFAAWVKSIDEVQGLASILDPAHENDRKLLRQLFLVAVNLLDSNSEILFSEEILKKFTDAYSDTLAQSSFINNTDLINSIYRNELISAEFKAFLGSFLSKEQMDKVLNHPVNKIKTRIKADIENFQKFGCSVFNLKQATDLTRSMHKEQIKKRYKTFMTPFDCYLDVMPDISVPNGFVTLLKRSIDQEKIIKSQVSEQPETELERIDEETKDGIDDHASDRYQTALPGHSSPTKKHTHANSIATVDSYASLYGKQRTKMGRRAKTS